MTYKEKGFRPFYHHFCVLPLIKQTASCIEGFPGAEEANGYLTYGYYDNEAGLTLEILAAAKVTKAGTEYFDSPDEIRSFIRINAVEEAPFIFEADKEGILKQRYAKKLEILEAYAASAEVEESRRMTFLDEARDAKCIDDVLVYLVRDGYQTEGCWTRICNLGDHYFVGILLNEPDQDFGFHQGEEIAFIVHKLEDGRYVCISDMNPKSILN